MSLLKRVNDIDLYVVPNQQWVVCAMYPYYKSLEKFFDFTNEDYKDISKGSCTVNGIQKPFDGNGIKNLNTGMNIVNTSSN